MPVLMPTTGIASVDKFELEYNDSINELTSGAAFADEIAPPFWDISMQTSNLTVQSGRYRVWRSFIDSLRGSKRAAFFYDPKKPYPSAYPDGIGGMVIAGTATTFTGDAVIQTIVNRTKFDINGVPAGFKLQASDYVSFMEDDQASLHRLIADGTANGAGEVEINVEPRVPLAYSSAAVVRFVRAPMLGIIQGTPQDSHDIESGKISFKARSVVIWGGGV